MRKKILTGFFVLIITSGLYGLAFGHRAGLDEKRLPAPAPAFKGSRLLESDYYARLGRFLEDRHPYRRPFIVAKNWIDYYIFDTSPSAQVHIGSDGWFYLKNGMTDYFKDSCVNREKARNLARELNSIEKVINSSGKRFFLIIAPDKATIYPEYAGIKRNPGTCGKSFYDFFLEALDEFPVRGFIRLDKKLIAAKKDSLLYFKKGTHWNYKGSALASNAILERLSTSGSTGRMPHIRFVPRMLAHDLAEMFALDILEMTEAARITKKAGKVRKEKMPRLPNGMTHLRMRAVSKTQSPLLPRTVIYRDSFMTLPLTIIDGSFDEIDALWAHRLPLYDKKYLDLIRSSNIIILEVVERNLYKILIKEKNMVWALGGGLRYKRGRHRL